MTLSRRTSVVGKARERLATFDMITQERAEPKSLLRAGENDVRKMIHTAAVVCLGGVS